MFRFKVQHMAEQQSTSSSRNSKRPKPTKPAKPYPEFPLTPASNQQWVRKIRGKIFCFGSWHDWRGALEKHNRELPYLKAGVPVPGSFEGPTVADLCNDYMEFKAAEASAGRITDRWLRDLHEVVKTIVAVIDKGRPVESLGPSDFQRLRLAIIGKHTPAVARNTIQRIVSVFSYAHEMRKISRPVDYGKSFQPPTKSDIRKHRSKKVKQLWRAESLRAILEQASPVRRAMLLLSLNCAFNGADIAAVPIRAIDFNSGWLDFPRTKTGVERVVSLWPETVAAIRDYMETRPDPHSEADAELLFVTRWGQRWTTSGIGHELEKAKKLAQVTEGTLLWGRKTLQTIGEETGDIVAVRAVMGHADDSMSAEYRQEISRPRLKRVADHVRQWLFGEGVAQ
jgi:integrase